MAEPTRLLCPICAKARAAQFAPFCSRRCADVDLHRWLTGVYAVPAVEGEDGDGIQEDVDSNEKSR